MSERAERLRAIGAEVVTGDLRDIARETLPSGNRQAD
jgi:hypothetical protein